MALDVVSQVLNQRELVRSALSRVKHKVAVMSGKGGVGKSAVTANLALALAKGGSSVGVLDGDIDGPSIPRMLGAAGQRLGIEAGKATPVKAMLNIKVISMALLLSSERAAVAWQGPEGSSFAWRGAMEMSCIGQEHGDHPGQDERPPGAPASALNPQSDQGGPLTPRQNSRWENREGGGQAPLG